MNRKWMMVITAAASLALAGCPPKEGAGGGAGGSKGGDIVVGEYGSMSGLQATFGESTDHGVQLALDEINAGGGVLGRKMKVQLEDDQSKQEEAANAVTKLISQDHVVAVVGEVASSNSLAAAPICQSNKIPMITPSSTNTEVTKKGDYIFRMCYVDPYQGKALADFAINDLKVKRAAILRDVKSDYALGLSQFFEQEFTAHGGQIVSQVTYTNGDSDFRSQLTSIKAANPEIIFTPGYYNDVGQIAVQARDLGMQQPLMGGDGWESPKLFEIGGKALNGSFYSNHYHSDDPAPEVRGYVERYQKKYGSKPDALSALGYDSMMVLVDAIKRAGGTDPKALRDAIAATKGFKGVTGTITLGPARDPVDKKLVVLEIQNGTTKLRATVDPSKPSAAPAQSTATSAAPAQNTATSAAAVTPVDATSGATVTH
jgi:branched-chain amino acid transport system substrate-binding protein